ncbi:hypothetical protein OG548_35415 [Streptomyces sp. NBC_01356]|uniref:hypothetical protein n=1 Tax=Streptomyces sp. NBC_01356 TaxID=2903836 RepID=UPI002E372D37|nr:hypothetical protein [Streptomyces sp. NBC_01356]
MYLGAATADPPPPRCTTLPPAFAADGVPISDAVGALGAGEVSPAQDHEIAAFAVQALRRL